MTTMWERVKTGGKAGFDKTWQALDKVGAPVNRLSNKLGAEAFWPTTLDKESDKAARILKSFCKDGFYAEEEYQPADGPKQKQKVFKKIPAAVIKNAKGLAIFTTMRTGLWMSGAGGSGVLVARQEDGSWSPPSGILLHTAGLGFMVGIDIYDCVVVINNARALEAFYKVRCTLGSEISVAAGPVGMGGVLESEIHKRQAPIFTYMKSRGFYAGVQIDGTIIIERTDENERFYNQRLPVKDILAGKVRHPPFEVRRLLETIKAAQGDNDFDASALPTEPPPGDYDVEDGQIFGVPDKEDPDPYGVLALEKEGMKVVEASTKERASWEQFSFNPSPTSPIHHMYARGDGDAMSRRGSWRSSMASVASPTSNRPSSLRHSIDQPKRASLMVDSSTQTDMSSEPLSPNIGGLRSELSRRSSKASTTTSVGQQMQGVPEHSVLDAPQPKTRPTAYTTPPTTPPLGKDSPGSEKAEEHTEEAQVARPVPAVPTIQTIHPAAATQVVSKARLVTVQKRVPPKLPPRNPTRTKLTDSPSSKASEDIPSPSLHSVDPLAEPTSALSTTHIEDSVTPMDEKLEEISLKDETELSDKRWSGGSSTWDKVKAMRLSSEE